MFIDKERELERLKEEILRLQQKHMQEQIKRDNQIIRKYIRTSSNDIEKRFVQMEEKNKQEITQPLICSKQLRNVDHSFIDFIWNKNKVICRALYHLLCVAMIKEGYDQFFFATTIDSEEIVNKLYETLEENETIKPEYLAAIEPLRDYFEDSEDIDFLDFNQKLATLELVESEELNRYRIDDFLYHVRAQYIMSDNRIIFYINEGEPIRDFPHEFVHVTGHFFDYPWLSEGITELVASEYCFNGKETFYLNGVKCARILCELVSPEIVRESFQKGDSRIIIEKLTSLFGDEIIAKFFLNEMEQISNLDQKLDVDRVKRLRLFIFQLMMTSDSFDENEKWKASVIGDYFASMYDLSAINYNIPLYFNVQTDKMKRETEMDWSKKLKQNPNIQLQSKEQ